MIQTNCSDCGKTWKLPSNNKVFKCKDCGGVVDPTQGKEPVAAEWPESPNCSACGELNAVGATFCEACGEAMSALGETKSKSRAADDAKADRRGAQRELGRLKKDIVGIRWAFITFAVINLGLAALLVGLRLMVDDADDSGGFVAIALGIQGLLCAVAAARINKEPYVWTLASAGFATVVALVGIVAGDLSLRAIFWAACLWAATPRAARVQRILNDYPDLSIKRVYGVGGVKSEAGKRRLKSMNAGRRKIFLMVAGGVVAAGVVAFFLLPSVLDSKPTKEIESFSEEWARSSDKGFAGFFEAGVKDDGYFRLQKSLERRGFSKSRPPLGDMEFEHEQGSESASARYQWDGGKLEINWRLSRGHWYIRSVDFPKVRPTKPIRDSVDFFMAAWRRADVMAISKMFVPERRGRAYKLYLKRFVQRGWLESTPKIALEDIEPKRVSAYKSVYFHLAGAGELKVTWRWQSGDWQIRKMALPK